MASVSMTGADTIILNTRLFTDLADGDCIDLTFPNEIAVVKVGKNGNSIYAFNATGQMAMLRMRVIRGSDDDKYLNNLLQSQQQNFAAFPLISGTFTKQVGNNTGTIVNDIYVVGGGVFTKQVEGKNNVEGNTDQSVSVYEIKFANAPRSIG